MACECALLRSEVAVALCGLLVETGRGLAKTRLLHAQLTKALTGCDLLLREVAVKTGCRLSELRLLRRLLARGLADVGNLTCGGLFGGSTLRFERTHGLSGLNAKPCLLRSDLRGLLLQSGLLARLLRERAADALIKLRLLRGLLLLRLFELRHLHRSARIESRLLKALLRRLQLELRLLAGELPLESRLLCGKLCSGLAELRLLHASADPSGSCRLHHLRGLQTESCLLPRGRCLELPRLRELLRGLLSESRLLRGDLCRLTTELPRGLCALERALLLLLKGGHRIGLSLRVALREEVGNRAGLLFEQTALHFCALHAFALATERARAHGLSRKSLLRNGSLALDLPHRLVDDLLTIRIHERLRTRRIVSLRTGSDRADALLNRLLRGLESRLACCRTGLFRCRKCSAYALLESRLLRGLSALLGTLIKRTDALLDGRLRSRLLRHGNRLLALADRLTKARLLCCLGREP